MLEVNILMSCKHINYMAIESAVFRPLTGAERKCSICHEKGKIVRVSEPYYMGETAPNLAIKDQKKK